MATSVSTTLLPTNASNAIATWAAWIENLFVTVGGWTLEADSGDTDPATLTTPGAANTKAGYRVYAMADAMQATAPVYVRVDYGSGSVANTPGVWLTIGTGHDGAGGITGIIFNGGSVTAPTFNPSSNTATGTFTTWGSADTARIVAALWAGGANTTISLCTCFGIERTKSASGVDTEEGLILAYQPGLQGSNGFSVYLPFSGSAPPAEQGFQFLLSSNSPSAFGSDVGVGVHIPMRGLAQPPGYNWAFVKQNDFAAEAQFTMTLYSTSVTYQCTKNIGVRNATVGSSASTVVYAIRYD